MPTPSICKIVFSALVTFFLATGLARADWLLDMDNSSLGYGSIKKNSIGENNHFQKMTGRISESGKITLLIDLTSVETWIDIRNDRMKEFFFQTNRFPVATLSGQVDMTKFRDLKVGEQRLFETSFDFDLHGHQQTVEAELVILRLTEKTVVVIPSGIIFLNTDNFALVSGLRKLQELAKLPPITTVVPVIFHLTFHQSP